MVLLITSTYQSKSESRNAEQRLCIKNNIEAGVDLVVNITEAPDIYEEHENYLYIQRENKPTFTELFGAAQDFCPNVDDVKIICNSDIYFDAPTIKLFRETDLEDTCLALSRHDKVDDCGCWERKVGTDSNDAWVYQGRLLVNANYSAGTAGCDNALNYKIARAGFTLLNPSNNIRCYHIHSDPSASHLTSVAPKPYTFPKFCSYNSNKLTRIYFICMGVGGINSVMDKWAPEITYKYSEYDKEITAVGMERYNEDLLRNISEYKPEIVFSQTHDVGKITMETIKKVMAMGIQWCNWTGDMSCDGMPSYYYDLAETGCITAYSNLDYLSKISTRGLRAYFFNIFDEDGYAPQNIPDGAKEYDVTFIGTKYSHFPNDYFRNNIAKELSRVYGKRFGLFGDNWDTLPHRPVGRAESNDIYNNSKIGLNISQVEAERYTSDRLCHLLASGTFTLCQHFPKCEELFTDGVHLRYFDTEGKCMELIEYYLKPENQEEKIRIAKAGMIRNKEVFGGENMKRVFKRINQFI